MTMSPLPLVRRRRSTLEIGTSFENHSLRYLNNELYMNLRRVGGAGDGGIDLRGWWWIPHTDTRPITSSSSAPTKSEVLVGERNIRRIRVIAQCKAEKKPLGPRAVRELEGVMSALKFRMNRCSPSSSSTSSEQPQGNEDSDLEVEEPDDLQEKDNMAILISQSGFTKSTMIQASSSNTPLMLVHLPGGQPMDSESTSTVSHSSISLSDPIESGDGFIGNAGGRESDREGEMGDQIEVQSLWWNKALSEGIIGGAIELRKTIGIKGVGVGLWMNGKKLGRCRPKSEGERD
ncbi:uncharacterized protein IL334_006629 [Kwoniella shivajii]|uniref:Impact N-terminal domain-containing protein n=1 Tax=Kwoniella shivajii TaxID=564305 RepID=A0ABZ1D6G5_9TREE|nr:hypothetical protein IL334_006629 [Kwoniella shivajii]